MPDDYIKRNDAIRVIEYYEPNYMKEDEIHIAAMTIRINQIPAANVEPVRHAQWIPGREIARTMLGDETLAVEYSDFHCSSCGQKYKEYVLIYKYCPNCGAKMEKEEENEF